MGRVAVTGASGYLGRALVRELSGAGFEPLALVRSPAGRNAVLASATGPVRVAYIPRAPEALAGIFHQEGVASVVHLAAAGGGAHEVGQVPALVDANLGFGIEVLEAMRLSGVSALLSAGSFWQHFENREVAPVSLYAALKQAFESVVRYYVDAFGLRAVRLTFPDIYGPGDTRGKVVPLICSALRSDTALRLTAGEQFLHLLHVRDAVRAVKVGLAELGRAEVGTFARWDVAYSEAISVRDFASVAETAAGRALKADWGAIPYRDREFFLPWKPFLPLSNFVPEIPVRMGVVELLTEPSR